MLTGVFGKRLRARVCDVLVAWGAEVGLGGVRESELRWG